MVGHTGGGGGGAVLIIKKKNSSNLNPVKYKIKIRGSRSRSLRTRHCSVKINKKVSVKHAHIDRVRLDLRHGRLVSGGIEFC